MKAVAWAVVPFAFRVVALETREGERDVERVGCGFSVLPFVVGLFIERKKVLQLFFPP